MALHVSGIPDTDRLHMNTRFLLLVLFGSLWLSACSHEASPSSLRPAFPTEHKVVFEIKSLGWTDTSDSADWSYAGHAIFVTKDPALQQGAAAVILQYRATPPEPSPDATDGWEYSLAVVTEGTGDIKLALLYPKAKYKEAPGPPKLEWRTLGYVRFSPAEVNPE